MFEGFELHHIATPEATIRCRIGGSGPPLLLLHGNPQTHVMWHRIAPGLAKQFTVVAADLRGYGQSSKPDTTAGSRALFQAGDGARPGRASCGISASSGSSLVGHDRGGRVAYRMALDHPDKIKKLAVLDILPTLEHYRRTDMAFATAYWHWFFLIQPIRCPRR